MKRNGFTLIELLAVIVILAIIALIATPIILGIINDAREKANERSIELYASAVRNGIAAYQLRELKEVSAGTYTSETLPFKVEYDGDVECTTIELYEDGGLYVADCTSNNVAVDYTYGVKQERIVYLNDVCDSVSVAIEGTYTAGDEYTCTVDPSKPAYTFYVLTTVAEGAESVNLIMDSNIRIGGEEVKEATPTVEQKGTMAWISEEDYTSEQIGGLEEEWEYGNNTKGPITAMNYLDEATKNWTNVNIQRVNTFTDNAGEIHQMAKEYKSNARLPYYSELSKYDGNNIYLYNYLNLDCYNEQWTELISCDVSSNIEGVHKEGMSHVLGVDGYWTLSSDKQDIGGAWYVWYFGGVTGFNEYVLDTNNNFGVRPVINLSI